MPTMGLIISIANDQIARNIDPDETLRYFSWTLFAVIAVVYTALFFGRNSRKTDHSSSRHGMPALAFRLSLRMPCF